MVGDGYMMVKWFNSDIPIHSDGQMIAGNG